MSNPPPIVADESPDRAGRRRRGEHARSTVRRKLLYSVVTLVAFFTLAELVLWALGVAPVCRDSDPFVGFSGQFPLFIERKTSDGHPRMTTAENRLAWFNRQSFPRDKSSGTYRIFCLGGSTTYGRPYSDKTSFAGWLRVILPAMDPSRDWEVINAGGISYASYRIVLLMREIQDDAPDLFVIYTGHNEFLEQRTYSSEMDTPEVIRRAVGLASHSRTFALMRRLMHGADGRREGTVLSADVDAILDRSVGPEAYHRDDHWRQQVLTHFRSALERMIDLAMEVGAEVVLVVPASNMRDFAPFKSQHQESLSNEDVRVFRAALSEGEAALDAGNLDEALAKIDRAIQIDPRHADAHFLRGRTLLARGDVTNARMAFQQAIEEDICPLRAVREIQDIVREVAQRRDVLLVDFAAILDQESEYGIPGSDWFLDHVHPTIAGHQRLARAVADELIARKIANPQPSWSPEALHKVAARLEAQISPRDRAMALRNLAKVLGWAGKDKESDQIALRAAENLPDDPDTQILAGFASLRLGRIAEAETQFQAALRIRPDDVGALNGLGSVYTRNDQHEKARACFARAIAIRPKYVPAYVNLGGALHQLGRLDEAAAAYQSALSLAPDQAETCKNLAMVRYAQGMLAEAVTCLTKAKDLENHVPVRHTDLGYILFEVGEFQQAATEFQAALDLDPTFMPALMGMALFHEQRGELSRAMELLRPALPSMPTDVNLHLTVARLATELNDFKTAAEELDIVLKLDPQNSEAKQLRDTIRRR